MAQGSKVDICSLLCSEGRDFLVRNCGAEVDIRSLRGKIVGLYFSASSCTTSRKFTQTLSDVYLDLAGSQSNYFQVVLVSLDHDEAAFERQFSRMPWLAVPFSDAPTIKRLEAHFRVRQTPLLVLIGAGVVLTTQGVGITEEYTHQLLDPAKEQPTSMELGKEKDELLDSLFRKKKIVSELGQMTTIALCFTGSASYDSWDAFTQKLFKLFHSVNEKADGFQVLMIYLDDKEEEEEVKEVEEEKDGTELAEEEKETEIKAEETEEKIKFLKKSVAKKPFLLLPLRQDAFDKLSARVEPKNIPWLVVMGRGGKTFSLDATMLVEEHVAVEDDYPFSPTKEKIAQQVQSSSTLERQTLESLLGSGEGYVHDNKGRKVKVSDLAQKDILLYFSAHWSPKGRAFTPKLIEAYHQIKRDHSSNFEVIFISSDRDVPAFKEHHSRMPWLALPYSDEEHRSLLTKKFKVEEIPALVYIGIEGQTVNAKVREILLEYGADAAFPFTDLGVKGLDMKKQRPQGEVFSDCLSASFGVGNEEEKAGEIRLSA